MPYVLTVDQRRSRRGRDLVDDARALLAERVPAPLRPFERTAGDEFQGVLADPGQAVDASLALIRQGVWSVGVGIGAIDEPFPESARAARGPVFVHARTALETAKKRPQHVAVAGPDPRADDADVVLTLLAVLVERRTDAGWEAIDLIEAGHTPGEAADVLGVTRQAVGQRITVACWQQEVRARPLAARLLEAAL